MTAAQGSTSALGAQPVTVELLPYELVTVASIEVRHLPD